MIAADRGKAIAVRYSYIDGNGNDETVISEPKGVPAPDGYWEKLYLKHIGRIDPEGLAYWRATGKKLFIEAARRDGTLLRNH